jgi:hypothetical protein
MPLAEGGLRVLRKEEEIGKSPDGSVPLDSEACLQQAPARRM